MNDMEISVDSDMIGGVAVNHLSPKVVEIMPKDGVVVDKLDIQMLEGGLSNCFAEVEALLLNAEFSFSMSFEGMRQLLKIFLNVKTLAFVYHNKHSKDVGRLIAQVAVLGVDDGVMLMMEL